MVRVDCKWKYDLWEPSCDYTNSFVQEGFIKNWISIKTMAKMLGMQTNVFEVT